MRTLLTVVAVAVLGLASIGCNKPTTPTATPIAPENKGGEASTTDKPAATPDATTPPGTEKKE